MLPMGRVVPTLLHAAGVVSFLFLLLDFVGFAPSVLLAFFFYFFLRPFLACCVALFVARASQLSFPLVLLEFWI